MHAYSIQRVFLAIRPLLLTCFTLHEYSFYKTLHSWTWSALRSEIYGPVNLGLRFKQPSSCTLVVVRELNCCTVFEQLTDMIWIVSAKVVYFQVREFTLHSILHKTWQCINLQADENLRQSTVKEIRSRDRWYSVQVSSFIQNYRFRNLLAD